MNVTSKCAIVEISPFAIVKAFDVAPDSIVWPDGSASHAVPIGFRHEGWMLAGVTYGPRAPTEFHQLTALTPSLSGDVVTVTQTWTPHPLEQVQAALIARLNQAAEDQRQRYLTPGAAQSMIYMQKIAEAKVCSADLAPVAANYPLLNASVGIEAKTLPDVAALVVQKANRWNSTAAAIEAIRLSAVAAIRTATTVEAALAAYDAASWGSVPELA